MAGNNELALLAAEFERVPAADGKYYVVRNKRLVELPTILTSDMTGAATLLISPGTGTVTLDQAEVDVYETFVLEGSSIGSSGRLVTIPDGAMGNWSIVADCAYASTEYYVVRYVSGSSSGMEIRVYGGMGCRIVGTGTKLLAVAGANPRIAAQKSMFISELPPIASYDGSVPTTRWVKDYGPGKADLSSSNPLIAGVAAPGTSLQVSRADHVHPAQAITHGYDSGAGGQVTQFTSRTTGVTINKLSGRITLFNASTTAGQHSQFTVTNSFSNQFYAVTVGLVSAVAGPMIVYADNMQTGSFRLNVYTPTALAASAPILQFAMVKIAIL